MKVTSCDFGEYGDSGNFVVSGEPAGSVATTFLECAKHLFRVACNTSVGLCATPFLECVQQHFRSVCNSISGVR